MKLAISIKKMIYQKKKSKFLRFQIPTLPLGLGPIPHIKMCSLFSGKGALHVIKLGLLLS